MKTKDLIKLLDSYSADGYTILSVCVSESENRLSILYKKDKATRCDFFKYATEFETWCIEKTQVIAKG